MPLAGRRLLLKQSAWIRSWLTHPIGKIVLVGVVIVVIGGFFFVRSLPHTSRGNAWVLQQDVDTSDGLSRVVWSGSQFVAVGGTGSAGVILTSADGQTWIFQDSGTTGDLAGVTWSGTQFVAVGAAAGDTSRTNGAILTSPDGRTWTSQNAGTAGSLDGITWSGAKRKAVLLAHL